MKVSKIPGLGRFGVFIDDFDIENASDEEWMEVGNIHLESLVTIIRNVNVSSNRYEERIRQWGSPKSSAILKVFKKYGITDVAQAPRILERDELNGVNITDEDKKFITNLFNILGHDITNNPHTEIVKVTGKRKPDGSPLGMFAEGELLWHSNESGDVAFSPGVSLLGVEGTVGSATGFITTPDWYESQTESFRSELDEMIIQHQFTPGRINPGLREDQDGIMHRNMCPEPNELPLVCQSPAGIKGIHYSINTIEGIKGMSKEESQKIFDHINKTLFVDEYIYDHWYQQDNDLCLFDNSVTLHRRLGGIADRMCYRLQYIYDKLVDPNWCPWLQEPYITDHNQELTELRNVLQ
jgi:alpha-ketoglutarate-dependent taurine dioxygenase